ncbi:MAG: histidine phosphatase family protein [Clostridia bacterium]|nr:histidine phosphatase family protein [Clostridia bacterium]
MLFFYMRHGCPIYHPDGLTALGKRQAEALGRRLAAHGMDRIFASSSQRAIDTATPLSELVGKEIVILDWANESYFGSEASCLNEAGKPQWFFTQEKYRQLFLSPEMRRLGDNWLSHPCFEGTRMAEGMARVAREADAFFEALGYRHDRENFRWEAVAPTKERVAMFAHGGFATGLLSDILDIPYPLFSVKTLFQHAGMTVIHFSEKPGYFQPQMLMMSCDSHLWRDGLPTAYNNGVYI